MKQNNFKNVITICCSALAALSCSEDSTVVSNSPNNGRTAVTFAAKADVDGSRTYIDGLTVKWSEGDAIRVFSGCDASDFSLTSGAGTTSGRFTGFIKETDRYYALYPNVGSCYGNVISGIEIPATQYAVSGSIPSNVRNSMVATCTKGNMTLAFKNVCAYLTIDIKYPCSSIVLTAGADDKIAGTFSATVTDGEPTITSTSGSNKITLMPAPGASSIPVGEYKIAIIPGTISTMEIVCNGTDNISATKTKSTATTVARKTVMNLGTVLRKNGWKELPTGYEDYVVDMGDSFSVYWAKSNIDSQSPFNTDETNNGGLFKLEGIINYNVSGFRLPTPEEFYELWGPEHTYGYPKTFNGVRGLCYYSIQYVSHPTIKDDDVHVFLPFAGWEWAPATQPQGRNQQGKIGYYFMDSEDGLALRTSETAEGSNFTYTSIYWEAGSMYVNKTSMKYSARAVFPKRNESAYK